VSECERERRRPGDFVGAHAYYKKMLGRRRRNAGGVWV
jgi:hypothetical protein